MEPRGSSVSPLRTRERSRALGLRKTTHGSRSGRSNGWAECREKKIGIEPMGSTFFLTSPLIGHCYEVDLKSSQSFGEAQARKPFFLSLSCIELSSRLHHEYRLEKAAASGAGEKPSMTRWLPDTVAAPVAVREGRSRIEVHRPYFSGEDSLASNKAGAFLL